MNARKPSVAGRFYPAAPEQLIRNVNQYITEAPIEPAPEKVVALIAPHAGYLFSGPTAGFAYARVQGKKPKRVILAGCSHRYRIQTASVYESGAFEIPTGTFPIDEPFAREVAKYLKSANDIPHDQEHCLEVQLPFLQQALGTVPLVPILFGGPAHTWHVEMGRLLASMIDENDLFIASTDLSHYLPEYEANKIDKRTIEAILSKDTTAVLDGLQIEAFSMCGESAVAVGMAFAMARNAHAWSLLDYRTSATASGDQEHVVGYAAISLEFNG